MRANQFFDGLVNFGCRPSPVAIVVVIGLGQQLVGRLSSFTSSAFSPFTAADLGGVVWAEEGKSRAKPTSKLNTPIPQALFKRMVESPVSSYTNLPYIPIQPLIPE